MTNARFLAGTGRRGHGRARWAVVLSLLVAACGILDVENPDTIVPEDLDTPSGLSALRAGAIGDYAFAVVGDNGATEGLILVGGSMSDELGNSETFPTRHEYDRRTIDTRNGTLTTVFRNIQRARRAAEFAAERYGTIAPDSATRRAEMLAFAGAIYNIVGEHYCSGVPFSELNRDGTITYGNPETTTQIFERAVARFDAALALTTASATVLDFARVGRARALLNLGRFSEAGTAATSVATTFAFNTTHTTATNRQQNGVFRFSVSFERFSMANLDGLNGLNFRAANDPRIPWRRSPANDVGFDGATPQFDQGKYASETSPVPVVNGVEARLIEAEAALQNNDPVTWLNTLNALRANAALVPAPPTGFPTFPALTPLADPGTPTARQDLHFRERAFWLYLTGRRLGDLRRLVRQYGRDPQAVYPGGGNQPYVIDGNPKGGVFGNDWVLPVSFEETNNPNFTGCLSTAP